LQGGEIYQIILNILFIEHEKLWYMEIMPEHYAFKYSENVTSHSNRMKVNSQHCPKIMPLLQNLKQTVGLHLSHHFLIYEK
jgi:hypothetical protein